MAVSKNERELQTTLTAEDTIAGRMRVLIGSGHNWLLRPLKSKVMLGVECEDTNKLREQFNILVETLSAEGFQPVDGSGYSVGSSLGSALRIELSHPDISFDEAVVKATKIIEAHLKKTSPVESAEAQPENREPPKSLRGIESDREIFLTQMLEKLGAFGPEWSIEKGPDDKAYFKTKRDVPDPQGARDAIVKYFGHQPKHLPVGNKPQPLAVPVEWARRVHLEKSLGISEDKRGKIFGPVDESQKGNSRDAYVR